ncbi:PAS domain S-box protein [Sphingomonadales bacterium 56]|uniref:hybrid sensor histidine kinase/response regulator n=1 Tax=unclassified Sphingobium TaxID=2611147 RepID=UPI001917C04F|nr:MULTISPECIES: PAS domain-containing sensor histidine kinase [unclassified Sphingobium]MBY2927408.1 PAS domain S-box protein [Sphingomonadales bacterium 56]MBY2957476.1 PAS domain S-box protein [Sphingomonadales bacterium 58]CAD7335131.1 Sensor histidine kinase RcsC [Sphingobium sp. S8]CAD7335150.1 Sensor histidine kinase RcsC [Sphingobium sp. S6]
MSTAAPEFSGNRFELLVQSVTDYAIYMLSTNGTIVSWNAGARRFKGYEADEIVGQHFSRFYTPEDQAVGIPALALETAERDGRFEAEGWRVRKDGGRFWASVVIDPIRDPGGTLIGFAKVTRDLTERRAAEEALKASEERFRLLVESVTDYAIYMLDAVGTITSWNAGAARFKGYTADEILGQNFSRFYSEEDRMAGIPSRALETASREGRFEAEGWRIRKDGSRFWANVVIDAIRSPMGELIGFAKITRDLTERRETQLALEEAREAIFQSQKMDAIGKLTGGVAHDFNNLLAVIVGSLDLARQRLETGGDISRYIDNAMTAADRGATLTQRMLAFARRQELKLGSVDCIALVRNMAGLLKSTLGSTVTIETRFPLSLSSAHADPAQLELALLNLAVNARDAMPGGGRIIVEGAEAHLLAEQRPDLPTGHYVRLSVIDEGEGMDEDTLARAREPFFTTKGIGKGTGLGLSMVHGFAEQCGGSLIISSERGSGTTVSLWLPVAREDANATDEERPAPSILTLSDQPLVILAVDDDDLVLTNTAGMLEELGHTVFQAGSGADALRMLAEGEVDLVITDHAMPNMTGAQLADALDETHPGLPVIIITGYAELPPHATKRLRLDKPFKQAELARMLSIARHDSSAERVIPFGRSPDF